MVWKTATGTECIAVETIQGCAGVKSSRVCLVSSVIMSCACNCHANHYIGNCIHSVHPHFHGYYMFYNPSHLHEFLCRFAALVVGVLCFLFVFFLLALHNFSGLFFCCSSHSFRCLSQETWLQSANKTLSLS